MLRCKFRTLSHLPFFFLFLPSFSFAQLQQDFRFATRLNCAPFFLPEFVILTAFLDARTLPAGTVLTPDLAIIGGGPAGISLALALADSGHDILLLESGGHDVRRQSPDALSRRPRPASPMSRWTAGGCAFWAAAPITGAAGAGRWTRSISRPATGCPIPAGRSRARRSSPISPAPRRWSRPDPGSMTSADALVSDSGPVLPLGEGGVYTSWFQFSKTRDGILPTHFGQRYQRRPETRGERHAAAPRQCHRHPPGAGRRPGRSSGCRHPVQRGNRFTVKPRYTVLAAGAMENARLLLASNDVMKAGVGNQNDLVGRFFADHPIPRDVATLVLFAGTLAPFYHQHHHPARTAPSLRARLSPNAEFARAKGVVGSLTTVENPVTLDELGIAAVVATAQALGVDASNAKAYSLGCGMELAPDPDRRLTLSGETRRAGHAAPEAGHDGSPIATLPVIASTLAELGRQLLAATDRHDPAELQRAGSMAGGDGLGQSSSGHHPHERRSQKRRGGCPKPGAWRGQSLCRGQFGVSHLWLVQSRP